MLQVIKFFAAVGIALAIATPASAVLIHSDATFDRTTWENNVPGIITNNPIDNATPSAMVINLGFGVTSTASNLNGFQHEVSTAGGQPPGNKFVARIGDNAIMSVTWDFGSPIIAFGADWLGAQNIFVTADFDGTGPQSFEVDAQIGSASGFLGFIGTTPFSSVTLSGRANGDFFSVDNLSFAAAPSGNVPEPSTLALIGFGLAGLGFARKRRSV